MMGRIGVLISGRGSNLQAIIDAIADGRLGARVAVVVSNRSDAAGLARARAAGIPTVVIPPKSFASREACDEAIVATLREHQVDLVCLAGYMRLVGEPILSAYPFGILNIHPSLLPAFPGLDAQAQADGFQQGQPRPIAAARLVVEPGQRIVGRVPHPGEDEAALGMVSSTGIDICNKVLLNDPISELVFNKFEVHEGSIEDKKRAI